MKNNIVCKRAHFIKIHCFKGAHLIPSEIQFEGAHLRILQGAQFNPKKRGIATFTWFTTKARMLPVKCVSSGSYVPPTMVAVVDTFEDRGLTWQSSWPRRRPSACNSFWRETVTISALRKHKRCCDVGSAWGDHPLPAFVVGHVYVQAGVQSEAAEAALPHRY